MTDQVDCMTPLPRTPSSDALAPDELYSASYRRCAEMARASGSNFYRTFRLLPGEKRRAMEVLYVYMRHTDNLVDNPLPMEIREAALSRWRSTVEMAMHGSLETAQELAPASEALEMLPALVDVVQRYQIDTEHLLNVIRGVQKDLSPPRFETFQEASRYCHQVATAVGHASLAIWGIEPTADPDALERSARACGIAFQWTNILRDLAEDLAQGRLYFPREDLRQCELSEVDLAKMVARPDEADEGFDRLIEMQIERTENAYREATVLYAMLEKESRPIYGMMVSIYHRLFRKIARRPRVVLQQRVRLNRMEKSLSALRWRIYHPETLTLPALRR